MVERSPEIFENEEKATTIEIKTVTPSIIYSVGLAASVSVTLSPFFISTNFCLANLIWGVWRT